MSRTVLLVGIADIEVGLTASYKRAFEALGFRVVPFNLDAARADVAPFGRLGQRLMGHLDFFALNAKANRRLVRKASEVKPDLVIIICTAFVRAATLLQIKLSLPRAKVVNIFPDTLFNLHDYVLESFPLYDLFCIHTRAGVPHLRRMGCENAFYLPLAADPFLHHPTELSPSDRETFGCDLVYVGNWRPEHEELFSALEGFDLAIWGSSYWGRNTRKGGWVRSRWRGRELSTGLDYAKAHLVAKAGLNPIDPLNFPSHNQRVFELPACGAFSLVSRTDEVGELFKEDETVVCFEGAEELLDKVRYYLSHDPARERIARRAYEHVVHGGHTYVDRARTILGELGLPTDK